MVAISLPLGTSTESWVPEIVTPDAWRPAFSDVVHTAEIEDSLKEKFTNNSDIFERNNSLSDSTSQSVKILQDITTKLFNFEDSTNVNNTTEVTFYSDDVTSGVVIGTAEKVVIGAGIIVVVLALVGIILRMCGPHIRSRKSDDIEEPEKPLTIDTLPVKLGIGSDLVGLASSESSGIGSAQSQDCSNSTGSTPISDWSSISSENNKTAEDRSTSGQSEQSMSGKAKTEKKLNGILLSVSHDALSVTSLPVCRHNDRMSSASSPSLHRRLPCDQLPFDTSQSLEPARFSDNYRDRWDDQWDPHGYAPRGNLSYHSHLSESQLSLNSLQSMTTSITSSNPGGSRSTFPIPPRDFVKQLHGDKEKRYPSNTKTQPTAKKEKHVRLSPPCDRKSSDR